jgi:hypothetical protein
MNAQTRQQTDARVQATVQEQLQQFDAAMRARELTSRNLMAERTAKFEAEIRVEIRQLKLSLRDAAEERNAVKRLHNARLALLERPWWKRLLGIGREKGPTTAEKQPPEPWPTRESGAERSA